MVNYNPPVSTNETDRLLALSRLDFDYSAIEDNFKDLTDLAAKLTGAPVSLINLIDSYTQWTISKHGIALQSMPREDSVCQYTIMGDSDHFEVKDLTADDRFKDKFYVARPDGFKYYLGVPLRNQSGNNIGALCVLNTAKEELPAEKIELLKIIAAEIVSRLEFLRKTHELADSLSNEQEAHKAFAHNVREPLSGIVGILEVILDQAGEIKIEEVLEYVRLMHKSSKAILSLTDAVLDSENEKQLNEADGDLIWLKEALVRLYKPICAKDGVGLNIITSARTERIPFPKNKLIQIAGNLVMYAAKQIVGTGNIEVDISLAVDVDKHILLIRVNYGPSTGKDVTDVLENVSTDGSEPETKGLRLTKILVDELGGEIKFRKLPGQTDSFEVSIAQHKA